MRLVDTHCHLTDKAFDAEGDATIARAHDAGVSRMLTLGVTLDDSRRALALARRHDSVLVAAGVHPHDAKDADDAALDALAQMASDDAVALVGEIGLDFYRDLSPRDVQERVFLRQLETARRARKPVAVHARDAHERVHPLLAAWSRECGGALADGRPLGVMHYFSGDAALAQMYIDLGFVISIHTSVTHPKAAVLQDVARRTPLEHLVLETDSPYGAPQRVRGKRNEPAYVADAANKVAELKGLQASDVAEATTRTALRLLGLAVAAGGATDGRSQA